MTMAELVKQFKMMYETHQELAMGMTRVNTSFIFVRCESKSGHSLTRIRDFAVEGGRISAQPGKRPLVITAFRGHGRFLPWVPVGERPFAGLKCKICERRVQRCRGASRWCVSRDAVCLEPVLSVRQLVINPREGCATTAVRREARCHLPANTVRSRRRLAGCRTGASVPSKPRRPIQRRMLYAKVAWARYNALQHMIKFLLRLS